MRLGDRIRLWLAKGLKSVILSPWAGTWGGSFLAPSFHRLCSDGLKANGAVFACISVWGLSYPEPPLLVYRRTRAGLEPVEYDHPLVRLLEAPAPGMGQDALLTYIATYRVIGGNAYLLKIRNRAGLPVELLPLHDGQCRPLPGGGRLVGGYEIEDGGTKRVLPPDDVIHFRWLPDPQAPWRGIAPLLAVAREVDTDNEATRYLYALLKNDAVPRLALRLPENIALSPQQYERLRREWQAHYGGEGRGGVAVLEGGIEVEKIALDLEELAFEALRRVPEARIAAAFRVPAVLAGLNVGLEQATYSNLEGLQRYFTRQVLVPMWALDDAVLTASLASDFGRDLVIRRDLTQVVALAEEQESLRAWVKDAVAARVLTINEARERLGYPRVANGDVFVGTLTQVDIPAEPAAARAGLKAASRGRRRFGEALLEARRRLEREMERDLEHTFAEIARRAEENLRRFAAGAGERKIAAEEVLSQGDMAPLEGVVRRYYVEVARVSWDEINAALGVDLAFDLADPALVRTLAECGTRIRQINETTLEEIRRYLQMAAERGWSIDHIVRGDKDEGIPGLRQLVEEIYRNRARTIARTELGTAQNTVTTERYTRAGLTHVLVLDDGVEDSDPECQALDGTVQTLEWAQEHPLGHPNCLRAFAPIVGGE